MALLPAPHSEVVGQVRVATPHRDGLTGGPLVESQLDEHVRAGVEPKVVELDDRQRRVHDG